MNPQAFIDHRAQTTGTQMVYRRGSLFQILYTDGVRVLAESCGAHWLIDLISAYRRLDFEVWHVEQKREGLVVKRDDGDYNVDVTQEVPYSDLPREILPLKLYCEGGVILLPEER